MIDKSKQYRTRDGRQVEIVCTDLSGTHPVLAIVTNEDGHRFSQQNTPGGRVCESHRETCPGDLIEVKPRIKRTYWVNVYKENVGWPWSGKESADGEANKVENRIACVPITIDCEEGEGLVEGK